MDRVCFEGRGAGPLGHIHRTPRTLPEELQNEQGEQGRARCVDADGSSQWGVVDEG